MTESNPSSTPPPNMVLVEPLTDAEAEAAFVALVTVLDKLGCAPAATVTGKEDAGVSFALHFDATRARKLAARSNQEATPTDDADLEWLRSIYEGNEHTWIALSEHARLKRIADRLATKPVQEATRTVGDAVERIQEAAMDATEMYVSTKMVRAIIDALSHTSSCGEQPTSVGSE
jgi:cell division protein FtsL